MSLTVKLIDLVRALRATVPFTDPEPYLSALETVHLGVDESTLTVTATDRFTLAHARVPATGELSDRCLHRHEVRGLLQALRPMAGALTAGMYGLNAGSTVTLEAAGTYDLVVLAGPIRLSVAGQSVAGWPKLRPLLDKLPPVSESANNSTVLDPRRLRRILRAVDKVRDDRQAPVRITTSGIDARPTRIEYDGWLLYALMPFKTSAEIAVHLPEPVAAGREGA